MKVTIRQLMAWAALAVAAPAAFGQLAQTLDAGGGLYATQIAGRALLRQPSGRVGELELPPGTVLRRLDALDGGWLASGEISAPGVVDLLLLRAEAGATASVPAPPNTAGEPLRAGPAPLVENGRLAGLAWLEGAGVRRTAVWAASWSGLDWSQPELVSPVGPGTQIALAGAVLADGSWLLVWSAYDGNDGEILWSRRVGGAWSEPALVHPPNDFPDVTPALVPTGRGALVAWNGYDGTRYRVRLAAFEDGGWRELEAGGPAGAVRPDLVPREGGAALLFRTVVPSGWTLVELDERGTPLRRAAVETETILRPGLAPPADAAGDLGRGLDWGFEWPGETLAEPRRVEVEWQTEP